MSKICRPTIPFQTGIPRGVYEGKMIEIKGRVPYGAYRFRIDLLTGYTEHSDIPLHLGIRFDQNCVVRNHEEHQRWGPEERDGPFPFMFGREFTIVIAVDWSKYRIAVNNQHCWDFRHRIPFERVKSLAIYGSIDVYEIDFIERVNPYLPAYPSTPAANPAAYANPVQNAYVAQERPRLPTVYNPSIPYAYPIYGGLRPGMMIHISGRPSAFPHKFTINLQKGAVQYPVPDVAFHFDCRFFNRTVVRNTRSRGDWASEETLISHFPFHPGVSFDLVIGIEQERYKVYLNGQHFVDFRHRLRPLDKFDTLYIENDVSISSISFS